MLKLIDYVWIAVILSIFGESFDHIKPAWYVMWIPFAAPIVMVEIISFFKPQNKSSIAVQGDRT